MYRGGYRRAFTAEQALSRFRFVSPKMTRKTNDVRANPSLAGGDAVMEAILEYLLGSLFPGWRHPCMWSTDLGRGGHLASLFGHPCISAATNGHEGGLRNPFKSSLG